MQFLISLESGSLFFSCCTISFIHYLRDMTFMRKRRTRKNVSRYYAAIRNGHHVISLTFVTPLQIPSVQRDAEISRSWHFLTLILYECLQRRRVIDPSATLLCTNCFKRRFRALFSQYLEKYSDGRCVYLRTRKLLNYVAKNPKLGSFIRSPQFISRISLESSYTRCNSSLSRSMCHVLSANIAGIRRVTAKLIPRRRISTRKDDTPTAE